MIGRRRKHPLKSVDRGVVTAEIVQGEAAIVVRGRMSGHDRQRRVELRDRLFRRTKRSVRDAGIDPRFRMLRHARQHLAEFFDRLLGAAKAQQRIGMLIENCDVIGRERPRFVEAVDALPDDV